MLVVSRLALIGVYMIGVVTRRLFVQMSRAGECVGARTR